MKPETIARARQTAKVVIPPLVSTGLMIACVFLFLLFYALFLPEWLVKPVIGTSGFIGATLGLIGLRWHKERSLTEVLSGSATIIAGLILLTAFGTLFLAGCLNPVVVYALPGSEIHVDGKYYRKVLPPEDGRPGGLQRENLLLKWEAHTIEIKNHPLAPASVEVFHERFPWGWMHVSDSGSEHDARCRSRLHVTPPMWQFESGGDQPDIRADLLNRELRDEAYMLAAKIFGDRVKRLPWDARERSEAEKAADCLTVKWDISRAGWNGGAFVTGASENGERRRILVCHRESRLATLDAPPLEPGKHPDAVTLNALWASSRGPVMQLLQARIHDEELLRSVAKVFLETPPKFDKWLSDHADVNGGANAIQQEISNLVQPQAQKALPPDEPSPALQHSGRTGQATGRSQPPDPKVRADLRTLETLAEEATRAASSHGERTRESMVRAIMDSLSWAKDRVEDPGLKVELMETGKSLATTLNQTGIVIEIYVARDEQRHGADEAVQVLTALSDSAESGNSATNDGGDPGVITSVKVEPAPDRHFFPGSTEVAYFTPASRAKAEILLQALRDAGIVSGGSTQYLLAGWQQRKRGTDLGSQFQVTFGRSEPPRKPS